MTGQTEPRLVDPTPFVPAQSSPAQPGPTQPGPAANSDGHAETTAGSLLAGRYRLGIRVGSDAAAGAEFWRAEDTVLRRDVAATVLRRLRPGHGPGRRRGSGPRPGDHRAGAAVGQLRAPRLRAAARRARPRRPGPARRGAGRRRRRVGARPQPGRRRRGRHAQAPRRGARPAAAGGGGRGGTPARPRAGLRPPPADPAEPRRPPADGLRAAAPGADPGRRRARSGRGPLHAAHRALAALAAPTPRGPG